MGLSGQAADNITNVHSRRHREVKDDNQNLASIVTSKIEDGNIKAAIRIMLSDDRPAENNAETLQLLTERHPPAAPNRRQIPDPEHFPVAQFTEEDICTAIRTFPAGSSGGPDGLRPQHLRDLISNKEKDPTLVTSLTAFVNLLMAGKCPPSAYPVLFGGRLIALCKKDRRNTTNNNWVHLATAGSKMCK